MSRNCEHRRALDVRLHCVLRLQLDEVPVNLVATTSHWLWHLSSAALVRLLMVSSPHRMASAIGGHLFELRKIIMSPVSPCKSVPFSRGVRSHRRRGGRPH